MASRVLLAVAILAILALAHSQSSPYTCVPFNMVDRVGQSGCQADVSTNNNRWPLYVPSGTNFMSYCHITNLPSDLVSSVNTLFPENSHPDPLLIRQDLFAYVSQENTNVSFTYVSAGAYNINQVGYALYNTVTKNIISGSQRPGIQRMNSSGGTYVGGCLQAGDSFKYGPFADGNMLIFYLLTKGTITSTGSTFWSYIDEVTPQTNPRTANFPPGWDTYVHGSWAYLTSNEITLFGFEDQSLGDADYNDVMFFLTNEGSVDYNEVTPYENGTLKICNLDTAVLPKSYAEVTCVQWGILESVQASSCLTYMAIPSGWSWAVDNAESQEALDLLAQTQWSYTGATCFLLATNETRVAGVGYTPAGDVCDPSTYSIKTLYNATSNMYCYNTACTNRFVLKGQTLGTGCITFGTCDPSTSGAIVATVPFSNAGRVQYPDLYSTYLRIPDGQLALNTDVRFSQGSSNRDLDVVLLIEIAGGDNSDMNNLRADIKDNLKNSFGTYFGANNAKFAFATYTPGQSAVNSPDLTFVGFGDGTASVWTTRAQSIPSANPPACSSSGSLFSAAATLMANPGLAWRSTAFRAIWIVSICNNAWDNTLKTAVNQTGVYPIIHYARRQDYPSNWASYSNAANTPVRITVSRSGTTPGSGGNAWGSKPLTGTNSDNPTVASLVSAATDKVVAYVNYDPYGFLNGLSGVFYDQTMLGSGIRTFAHNIKWSTRAPVQADPHSVIIRVLGRWPTQINIRFNHPPTLSNVNLGTINGGTARDISLQTTDADGNLLTVQFNTVPTKGVLTRKDNGATITTGMTLPQGMKDIVYTAGAQASGADSWTMTVSDGCATGTASGSVTINFVNSAPTASNIEITINEDVGWNNLGTDNNYGRIDFSSYISDIDNQPPNNRGQTLRVVLLSLPSPAAKGSLNSWVATASGSALALANPINTPYLARYVHTAGAGFGDVTFQYKVNDGALDSAVATVTVHIMPINHAPVLYIPVTSFTVQSSDLTAQSLAATITDVDGNRDTVNLIVKSSTLTASPNSWTVKSASVTYDRVGQDDMYSASFGPSPTSGTTFPCVGLTFQRDASGASGHTVTFAARDAAGLESAPVTVTFNVAATYPPVWTDFPPSTTFQIPQEGSLVGLFLGATDQDSTPTADYNRLIFTLQSKTTTAAQATVRLLPLTSGANRDLVVGNTFTRTSDTIRVADNTTTATPRSTFKISYIPDEDFYGDDSFTFTVEDPAGHQAATSVTINVHVERRLTPPVSADSAINALEEAWGSTDIFAQSTNDVTTPVVLRLLSVDFLGVLAFDNSGTPGSVWSVGGNTTGTTSTVAVFAKGQLGAFSASGVPTGTFTYEVIEPTAPANNVAGPFTGRIYITHVNHPPTSANVADTILKREILARVLSASDPDSDDLPATIGAYITSIAPSSKGKFYNDSALSVEIDDEFIANGGYIGTTRNVYYQSLDDFSPSGQPLAVYNFIVRDQHGSPSVLTYTGTIIVNPAGDVPTFDGARRVRTFQETPVPMVLNVGVETETGGAAIAKLVSLPARGDLAACTEAGVCTKVTAGQLPFTLPSTTGRVVFTPRLNDWDTDFANFNWTLTDPLTGAAGPFRMDIEVVHVNKAPRIAADNFLTTAETSAGIVVNESSSRVFTWHAWDVDSTPSKLSTNIRVAFYATGGFTLYQCTGDALNWADDAQCTFDPSVPFGVRSEFVKNAKKTIGSYSAVTTYCPDDATLKSNVIADGEAYMPDAEAANCQARFKFNFVPTPLASNTPYISINFVAVDDYETESASITALIYVKAVNSPPTISSPPVVLAASGIKNPFLRDTDQDSPNFNNPVQVDDEDAGGNAELLIISVNEGSSGNLIWPDSAPCAAAPNVGGVWYCKDKMTDSGFKRWLGDLRFEVTAGDSADLTFTINDLGFTSDYKPSANLTATSQTTIKLTAAIAVPKGNSSTLAIAVGVAAAAGLLLLGALGFFLRKAVSPPKDDYFSAATTPLSAAPQSPLYQAQNETHESALYKPKA